MSEIKLAQVLRDVGDQIDEAAEAVPYSETQKLEMLRDAAELARVLARLVNGMDMHRAFGAPGDWGYRRPIGAALIEFYRGAIMSRYTNTRREQRGHHQFVVGPAVSARYAKPSRWRVWLAVLVVAIVLGTVPLLLSRAMVLALWGAA